MSTRSTINIVNGDGSVRSIYCHWDGYLNGVGAKLINYYRSRQVVDELIDLGSISVLGQFVYPDGSSTHSFETPQKDVVVAYHRDRKEKLKIDNFKNLEEMRDGEFQEFNYYFFVDDAVWKYHKGEFIDDMKLLQLEFKEYNFGLPTA